MKKGLAALAGVLLCAAAAEAQPLPDAGSADAGPIDAGPADAGASEAASREDAMFGGGTTSPADAGPAAQDANAREDAMFGGASTPSPASAPAPVAETATNPGDARALLPVDEKAIARAADLMNDKLTVGGLMYMQLQYTQTQGAQFDTSPLTSPNLLDVYFDARPNDDLRVYVRARLIYNPMTNGAAADQLTTFGTLGTTVCTSQVCPYVDQFWMKWNIAHKVFFTLGQQHIKWGAGRFWNPTDFLNPVKLNPLDPIDQRLGVDMLKIHVPIESKAINLYAIVYLDSITDFRQIGYAGRFEVAAGPTELTASVAYRDGQPLKLGSDFSFGVGDFDGHVEAAVLHPIEPDQIVVYETNPALQLLPTPGFSTPVYRDLINQWLGQVVAGGEYSIKYSDSRSLLVGAEYFFNQIGYPNGSLYPALIFTGNFEPLYNGRNYLTAYLTLPNPGPGIWNNTTFQLSWIANLSDQTYVARLDYRVTVLTFMQVVAYAAYFFGGDGEFHFSYNLPPTEQALVEAALQTPGLIPAQYQSLAQTLANGIKPMVAQVGAGIIMNM